MQVYLLVWHARASRVRLRVGHETSYLYPPVGAAAHEFLRYERMRELAGMIEALEIFASGQIRTLR